MYEQDTATSWNGGLPSSSLSLSFSVVLSSHLWLFLSLSHTYLLCLSRSLARALAHALGLMNSSVLEDTSDTPTWSNGVLPSPVVSLSLSVFFSVCLWLSLTRRSCLALSLARALALSRRLIYSCALEGTIDTPTCWNGVLQSPSVIVSSHLWLFLSFSLISLVSLSCARSRTRARPRH